jgi:hypothetical protein
MAKFRFPVSTVMAVFTDAAQASINELHLNIQQDLKKMLNIGGPGAASKPGRPPHKQSGNLSRSWQYGPMTIKRVRWDCIGTYKQARIGSATKYAAALEYGYPARNLKPRPYLRRVIRSKKQHRTGEKIFKRRFKQAVLLQVNRLVRTQNK